MAPKRFLAKPTRETSPVKYNRAVPTSGVVAIGSSEIVPPGHAGEVQLNRSVGTVRRKELPIPVASILNVVCGPQSSRPLQSGVVIKKPTPRKSIGKGGLVVLYFRSTKQALGSPLYVQLYSGGIGSGVTVPKKISPPLAELAPVYAKSTQTPGSHVGSGR